MNRGTFCAYIELIIHSEAKFKFQMLEIHLQTLRFIRDRPCWLRQQLGLDEFSAHQTNLSRQNCAIDKNSADV